MAPRVLYRLPRRGTHGRRHGRSRPRRGGRAAEDTEVGAGARGGRPGRHLLAVVRYGCLLDYVDTF